MFPVSSQHPPLPSGGLYTSNKKNVTEKLPGDPLKKEKERLKGLSHLNTSTNVSIKSFTQIHGEPKLTARTEPKTFGLLHGDPFLKGTGYVGKGSLDQAKEWKKIFQKWQDPSYIGPCRPEIAPLLTEEIMENLEQFEIACTLFEKGDPKEIREFIESNLVNKGHCVIPLNTAGAKGRSGHAFACVLDQDRNGRVTATILNAGEGSNLHPLAEIDHHFKRSLMFNPIEFNRKNYFEKNSKASEKLISFLCDFSHKTPDKDYNINEVYDLLLSQGFISERGISREEGVIEQRSGTCPAKALKLINRYYFLKKHDIDSYKKVIFSIKFQSLYDIYSQLQLKPQSLKESDIALIQRALCQFSYLIEKQSVRSPQVISDQMLLSSRALVELIHESLKINEEALKKNEKIAEKKTDFYALGKTLFEVTLLQKDNPAQDKVSIGVFIPKSCPLECPEPQDLLKHLLQLNNTHQISDAESQEKILHEVKILSLIEAFKNLPIPQASTEIRDPYWDALPEEDRLEVMGQITEILQHISKETKILPSNAVAPQIFITYLSCWAILDRLARKNPLMHLENVSYDLNLQKLDNSFYFLDGRDNMRMEELRDYFLSKKTSISPSEKTFPIFDFSQEGSTIDYKDEDLLIKNHRDASIGFGAHLRYLDRLLPKNMPTSCALYFSFMTKDDQLLSPESKEKIFFKTHRSSIPKEYYLLQQVAIQTQNFLSLDKKKLIPSEQYSSKNYPKIMGRKLGIRDTYIKEKKCDGSEVIKTPFLKDYYNQIEKNEFHQENQGLLSSITYRVPLNSKEPLKPSLTASIRNEFVQLISNPQLSLSLVMKFIEDNPFLVEDAEIRYLLEVVFLNGTSLIERIQEEPLCIPNVRAFFERMIDQSRNVSHSLYWMQLATLVETHISVITQKDIPKDLVQKRIHFCYSLLKKQDETRSTEKEHSYRALIHFNAALNLGLSKQKMDPKEDASILEQFLTHTILYEAYQAKPEESFRLEQILKTVLCKHSPSIEALWKEHALERMQPCMQSLGILADCQEGSLKCEWPTLSFTNSHNQKIDIQFPYIFINNEKLTFGTWPSLMQKDQEIHRILEGKFPPVLKVGRDRVRAVDGSFEIFLDSRTGYLEFKKRFSIEGLPTYLEYIKKSDLKFDHLPTAFLENAEFWKNAAGEIFVIEETSKKPLARISISNTTTSDKPCLIEKVNENWKVPLNGLSLIQFDSSHLEKYFSLFYDPKEILAWGKKWGLIKTLHLPKYNLIFDVDTKVGDAKCHYGQNTEFIISSSKEDILNPLSTAIYLENEKDATKKGMILPFGEIQAGAFGTSPSLRFDHHFAEDHFFYEFNLKTGKWESSSQLAMLYLIYALKSHGRHAEAYDYLMNFHPTNPFDANHYKVLKSILSNNHDARDTSLAIKIYLAFQHNKNIQQLNIKLPQSDKFFEEELTINRLIAENAARLLDLMGYDLSRNRLHYSPEVPEMLSLAKKFNHQKLELFEKLYKKSSYQLETATIDRSPSQDTLLRIGLEVKFIKPYSKLSAIKTDDIKVWKNLSSRSSFNLIPSNSSSIDEIMSHYMYRFLNKNLVEEDKLALKMEMRILLNRFPFKEDKGSFLDDPTHQKLVLLFYAAHFPELFKQCAEKSNYTLSCINVFLNLPELKILANEILEESTPPYLPTPLPSKEIPRPIQPEEKIQLNFPQWKMLKSAFQVPLNSLYSKYFNPNREPILKGFQEFALKVNPQDFKEGDLEIQKVKELSIAFNEKVPKDFVNHHLVDKRDGESLVKEIEEEITFTKKRINTLEDTIKNLLNSPSDEELAQYDADLQKKVYSHRIQISQGKVESPDFKKHVLPSLFLKQPHIVQQVNPFLTQKEIDSLYNFAIEYMLEQSKVDQSEEALTHAIQIKEKPTELQEVAALLSKKRNYNPFKYPEMLIYEYATGNMLRNQPDQALLLKTIIKTLFDKKIDASHRDQQLKRLFFEFQAGGGKTKVLSAILAAKAQSEGKIPIFFSLPSLVDIVKEDLRVALESTYQMAVVPVYFPLNKPINTDKVEQLESLLEQKGICIVMEPESWHSMKLHWQKSLQEGTKTDEPNATYNYALIKGGEKLWNVFELFKEKGLFIIDEEHRNVSSMIESNVASGKPISYPKYSRDLMVTIYKALYGWIDPPLKLKDGQNLHAVLGLAQDRQVSLAPEIVKEVIGRLAEYMVEHLKMPELYKQETLEYITDKTKDKPAFLNALESKKEGEENPLHNEILKNFAHDSLEGNLEDTIYLLRGLMCTILPHAFSQKDMMNYGPSPNPEDDIFDPYILGNPAGPKFQDTDVAAAITVQGLFQHGLNALQMKRFLVHKLNQLRSVKTQGEYNKIVRSFQKLNPPPEYPIEKMEIKDLDNPQLIKAYSQSLAKHPEVLHTFAQEIALKQIKFYPYKFTSTNQELSVGASAVIHTSATLGALEENPYIDPSLFLTTPEFMADVMQRALLPHNQETHWLEDSTPLNFFNHLYQQGTDFSRIDGVINIGGMCKDALPDQWAKDFIAFNKQYQLNYEAVIIAKDEKVGESIERRLYIVQDGKPDVLIQGSDVKKALKKQKLSEARVFKVYSPDMTTGTDLVLAPDAKMLLTLGENVTLSSIVQAIMRMRGFLKNPIDPKTAQSLIWVGSNKIQHMLSKRFKEATPRTILLNCLSKQAELEVEAIKMRAMQDIQMVIRSLAEQDIKSDYSKYAKYRKLFEVDLKEDARSKYSLVKTMGDTADILWGYANSLAKDAHFNLQDFKPAKGEFNPEGIYEKVYKRIQASIEQAKAKVATMENAITVNLAATSFQQVQQMEQVQVQQEMKQQQMNLKDYPLTPARELDYPTRTLAIGRNEAIHPDPSFQANKVFETDFFSPNLYVLPNFTNTVEGKGPFLKPAHFILATINKETGQKDYRLISNRDAELYGEQLRQKNREGMRIQSGVIFTTQGTIHQTDKSAGGLPVDEVIAWQQSDEFKQILAEVGLINGKRIEEIKQWQTIRSKPHAMKSLETILNCHLLIDDPAVSESQASLKAMLSDSSIPT